MTAGEGWAVHLCCLGTCNEEGTRGGQRRQCVVTSEGEAAHPCPVPTPLAGLPDPPSMLSPLSAAPLGPHLPASRMPGEGGMEEWLQGPSSVPAEPMAPHQPLKAASPGPGLTPSFLQAARL